MEKEKHPVCPAIWFSGFFGFGAVVHLARLLFQFPVTIGTWAVPMGFSVGAVIVFGALSAGLLCIGRQRPCCGTKECRQ